ncbi:Sodium/hydrogen exchanger 4 [Morella rubra]|uniref:Sodium/hydrogen exchanger 4 n=1 Tax=Morella rubra TaxID=262757 RepID=A0A6A1WP97_9ROSI|nr:Sodium/hydrogen exchanger 4 [Morella rubra]
MNVTTDVKSDAATVDEVSTSADHEMFEADNRADAKVVPLTVFVAVLCLCIIIGQLLEENRWVNESISAILTGCVAGTIILLLSKGKSSQILKFNEELFFIYLLPPIIFNAGSKSLHVIVGLGCWWLFPKLGFVGLTAQDYVALGTIFSSTDTVCTLQVLHQDETPLLYSLVFGEGVVNDATTVVLFNAVQKLDVSRLDSRTLLPVVGDFFYLFLTSTALGVIAGLVTAYVLKTLCFGRHSSVREIALMVLMAYLSYMLAELLNLSGILTVFFCGILMSHYAWHNLSESSKVSTRHLFATMSFIAETFIFLYVGMDALDIEMWRMTKLSSWQSYYSKYSIQIIRLLNLVLSASTAIRLSICFETSMGICSTLILLILLGRAAFVFPLSTLSNYMNRKAKRTTVITFKHQIIIWWAGLMRGAVSIALTFKQFTYSGVTSDPINATMIINTIIIVLFSTLVFGFLTKPLISYLNPHHESVKIGHRELVSPTEPLNMPLLSFEESAATNISRAKDSLSLLLKRPVYTIHFYWRKFDDTYMRPIFGGPVTNLPEQ